MGQLAKDWTQLKSIIRQKDDAIDHQSTQIADLQKQLAQHQQAALDADDQKAVAELRQTIATNAAGPAPAPTANATKSAATPLVATFTK